MYVVCIYSSHERLTVHTACWSEVRVVEVVDDDEDKQGPKMIVALSQRNADINSASPDPPVSSKLPLSCFRKLGSAIPVEELKGLCSKRSRCKESQEGSEADNSNTRKGTKATTLSGEKKDEGWMLEDVGLRPVFSTLTCTILRC